MVSFGVQCIFMAVVVVILEVESAPKFNSTSSNEVHLRRRRDTDDMCASAYDEEEHRELAAVGAIAQCSYQVCEQEIETANGRVKVPSIVCLREEDNCVQVYVTFDVIKNNDNMQIKEKERVPMGCVYSTHTLGSSSQVSPSMDSEILN